MAAMSRLLIAAVLVCTIVGCTANDDRVETGSAPTLSAAGADGDLAAGGRQVVTDCERPHTFRATAPSGYGFVADSGESQRLPSDELVTGLHVPDPACGVLRALDTVGEAEPADCFGLDAITITQKHAGDIFSPRSLFGFDSDEIRKVGEAQVALPTRGGAEFLFRRVPGHPDFDILRIHIPMADAREQFFILEDCPGELHAAFVTVDVGEAMWMYVTHPDGPGFDQAVDAFDELLLSMEPA